MNKVYFISGIRGSGKNTLISKLTSEYADDFQQALSVKTREPRPTETLGIDYIKYKKFNFLWETQILPLFNIHHFIERNNHFGEYYGTRKQEITKALEDGKNVLKEIEPEGLTKVFNGTQKFPYQGVFLNIPDEVIEHRMLTRNPDECSKNIQLSIQRATMERNVIDSIRKNHGKQFIISIDSTQHPQEVFNNFTHQINYKGAQHHS